MNHNLFWLPILRRHCRTEDPTHLLEALRGLASRAERRLVYFRLFIVLLNIAMYLSLDPALIRMPRLALAIVCCASIYVLTLVFVRPKFLSHPRRFSGLVPVVDGLFLSLWVAATGGFQSPFYVVYYVGIVGVAFSYATYFMYGLSLFYISTYVVSCVSMGGPLSISELIFRSAIMVLAAGIGEMIVGESVAQATNKARYNEIIQESARMQEIFRNVQDDLETAVEQRTRELAEANDNLQAEIKKRIDTEAALKKSVEETERANRAKSEFLANVSHEIRTPLNAVVGYAELLADSAASLKERALYADTVRKNGKLLGAIIGDILDLSKIESGTISLEMSDVDVRLMLDDLSALFRKTAEDKGLLFHVMIEENVPEYMLTDGTRLKQILVNLLNNAVKFTERGAVVVRVDVDTANRGDSCLKFTVSDTGIGIPREKQSRIFAPFTQADSSTSKKHGGTGLGLAISRKLAEKMCGTLSLERSSENVGSTFVLSLPISEASLEKVCGRPKSEPRSPSSSGELAGRSLLVVDDAADNQILLKHMLEKAGASRVDLAEDGVGAIRLGSANKYDAILMDLQMPRVDGFQANQALRRLGVVTPIIAVTAHAMAEVRERTMEEGFSGFIAKPVMRTALISAVKEAFQSPIRRSSTTPADTHA